MAAAGCLSLGAVCALPGRRGGARNGGEGVSSAAARTLPPGSHALARRRALVFAFSPGAGAPAAAADSAGEGSRGGGLQVEVLRGARRLLGGSLGQGLPDSENSKQSCKGRKPPFHPSRHSIPSPESAQGPRPWRRGLPLPEFGMRRHPPTEVRGGDMRTLPRGSLACWGGETGPSAPSPTSSSPGLPLPACGRDSPGRPCGGVEGNPPPASLLCV